LKNEYEKRGKLHNENDTVVVCRRQHCISDGHAAENGLKYNAECQAVWKIANVEG